MKNAAKAIMTTCDHVRVLIAPNGSLRDNRSAADSAFQGFADKLGVGSAALRVSVEAPLTLTVPYPSARTQETLLPTLPRVLLPAKYSTVDLSNQSLLLQIL